ncbi:MAG TPA: hypothetical protein VGQ58_03910 [Candidatus Limnocylindrales bacterium]|jgi:hypothetical protein|nr:hypothetical protein [Candidatus Limnocylindrales bacterium]
MRSIGRAARLAVVLAVAVAPVACSQVPVATPRPTTTIPSGSRGPTATGASIPIPPSPTTTPLPGGLAEWRQLPPQDNLADARFLTAAWVGDRFLGMGCVATTADGCVQPAIWESRDALEWQMSAPVFLAPDFSGGSVVAAASSRIGTVAAGNVTDGDKIHASIWLRGADGWAQVTPQSSADSAISALLATDGRVMAVGSGAFTHFSGFRGWWSADGTTWQAAPSVADEGGGYPTDLLPVEGGLLAWGTSCGDVCPVLPSSWWFTTDGTAWQTVGPPPGLGDANVTAIGRTEGGYAAFGTLGSGDQPVRPAAWVADETAADWRSVDPPPQPEATSIGRHLLVGHGEIVAGSAPPGPGREQLQGLVWLRGPGETAWRAPVDLPDFDVIALLQVPQQLNRVVVIGRTFEGLEEEVVIWTGLVDWAP